jgi:hypothetical protein
MVRPVSGLAVLLALGLGETLLAAVLGPALELALEPALGPAEALPGGGGAVADRAPAAALLPPHPVRASAVVRPSAVSSAPRAGRPALRGRLGWVRWVVRGFTSCQILSQVRLARL